jgi:hypothetical protein
MVVAAAGDRDRNRKGHGGSGIRAMSFSQVRGYSLLDVMLSVAAIATGLGVVRGLARLAPQDFVPAGVIVAVPVAHFAALGALAALVRLAGRQALWEERWVSLLASLWLVVMPATILLVVVWSLLP